MSQNEHTHCQRPRLNTSGRKHFNFPHTIPFLAWTPVPIQQARLVHRYSSFCWGYDTGWISCNDRFGLQLLKRGSSEAFPSWHALQSRVLTSTDCICSCLASTRVFFFPFQSTTYAESLFANCLNPWFYSSAPSRRFCLTVCAGCLFACLLDASGKNWWILFQLLSRSSKSCFIYLFIYTYFLDKDSPSFFLTTTPHSDYFT